MRDYSSIDERIHFALQAFTYEHLPPHLQEVSRPFCELAAGIAVWPYNPATEEALGWLMKAKDAAVRAALAS